MIDPLGRLMAIRQTTSMQSQLAIFENSLAEAWEAGRQEGSAAESAFARDEDHVPTPNPFRRRA